MLRKYLTGLTLAAVVTGGAFAQENTVTVDIGPTIVGVAMPIVVNAIFTEGVGTSTGLGIAAQYERRILEQFSVAGRFAYMGLDAGASVKSGKEKTSVTYKPAAVTVEGHARYYPFSGADHLGKAFFCDGMLGYAYMNSAFYAEYWNENGILLPINIFAPDDAQMNFFKLGAKVGTRIVFGDNGGFVFEQAVGWDLGVGGGEKLGTKYDEWAKKRGDSVDQETVDTFNGMFKALEDFIFAGGPRVTLSIGWNF